MIEIVAATRLEEAAFWSEAPLAASLARVRQDPRVVPQIRFSNKDGLSSVYNARIDATDAAEVLVFVHDDVWGEDFYFVDRILEGLKIFDVIGLAGNTRRVRGQTRWANADNAGGLDLPHLRGAIAHGDGPMGKVGFFGPIIGACELLDGVLLAARKSTLRRLGARFDARFDFHFYDLDFCRSARAKGLRLGTWPLSVTHRSTGSFTDQSWERNAELYRAKWKE